MSNKILTIKKSTLVDIADQIRAKTGSADLIAIEDLDDAVANLQGGGGGVVEVDVLPEPYLYTPVPNAGYVEKAYFNTSLSIDQVVAELEKLTYYDDGSSPLLVNDDVVIIAVLDNGVYGIFDANTNTFYFASEDPSGEGQFPVGWNPDFSGEIEVNSEVLSGTENDKIANLFYLNKQLNPEFNAEAIYKLPDETLWIYEDGWIELVKQTNESVGMYYTDDMMKWFGTDGYTEFKKPTTVVVNQDQINDYDIKLTMPDGKIYKYKKAEELYSEPIGFEPVYSNMDHKIDFHFKNEDAPVVTLPFVKKSKYDNGAMLQISRYFNHTSYNYGVIFDAESFFKYRIEAGTDEEILPSVFPSKLGMFWVGHKDGDYGGNGVADFQDYFTNENITLEGTLENDRAYVVCNLNEALGLTDTAIDHLEITAPGHETLLKMYRYTTPS
jgi:hypothetical protein